MDLFSTQPQVLSVTELTRSVRSLLEAKIGQVWVEGEISNYRRQSSGHQYFALKDDRCQVQCVMFYRASLKQIPLADGMQVQVRGDMTVYEARGQYQITVSLVQAAGVGLLQAKFEALKKKLEAEGLFDAARKRPLPKFPKAIGIVTSPTGAAIRDMLNILHRRAPWIEIVINPVRVQGEGASREIAAAVAEFNDWRALGLPPVDVIVVCRGGGSAEDLWEFNEEIVARAIHASEIPVVSAVGHEIDFTISDFVADLRAPTPSAAAELIAPDAAELRRRLFQIEGFLERELRAEIQRFRARLSFISRGVLFRQPQQRIAEYSQRIDLAEESLERNARTNVAEMKRRLEALHGRVRQHTPGWILQIRSRELAALSERLVRSVKSACSDSQQRLQRAGNLLRVLGPQGTLDRGYSITTNANGEIVRSVADVASKMKIVTRLHDGSVESVVS